MTLTDITLPIGASATVSSIIVGIVVWVFANFERKIDAAEKHKKVEEKLKDQDKYLQDISKDVNYIRGRIEPK